MSDKPLADRRALELRDADRSGLDSMDLYMEGKRLWAIIDGLNRYLIYAPPGTLVAQKVNRAIVELSDGATQLCELTDLISEATALKSEELRRAQTPVERENESTSSPK